LVAPIGVSESASRPSPDCRGPIVRPARARQLGPWPPRGGRRACFHVGPAPCRGKADRPRVFADRGVSPGPRGPRRARRAFWFRVGGPFTDEPAAASSVSLALGRSEFFRHRLSWTNRRSRALYRRRDRSCLQAIRARRPFGSSAARGDGRAGTPGGRPATLARAERKWAAAGRPTTARRGRYGGMGCETTEAPHRRAFELRPATLGITGKRPDGASGPTLLVGTVSAGAEMVDNLSGASHP